MKPFNVGQIGKPGMRLIVKWVPGRQGPSREEIYKNIVSISLDENYLTIDQPTVREVWDNNDYVSFEIVNE